MRIGTILVALTTAILGLTACGDDGPRTPAGPTAQRTLSNVSVRAEGATTVPVGGSLALTACARYRDGSEDCSIAAAWRSLNPEIATVEQGTVTGVAAGEATIEASYQSLTGALQITVEAVGPTATYEFDPAPPTTIKVGESGVFRVNRVEGAHKERVTDGVSSSSPGILRIEAEGDRWRYTGAGAGTAEIRVDDNGLRRLTHAVTVEPAPAKWQRKGTGNGLFDLPAHIRWIRIEGEYDGLTENFVVWCGAPGDRYGLIVNVVLGTHWSASGTRYDMVHSARRLLQIDPCRQIEIRDSDHVVWSITEAEEPAAAVP